MEAFKPKWVNFVIILKSIDLYGLNPWYNFRSSRFKMVSMIQAKWPKYILNIKYNFKRLKKQIEFRLHVISINFKHISTISLFYK